MNKNDLAGALVEAKFVTSKKVGEQIITTITNAIKTTVAAGEPVVLPGFGKFMPASQKGKTGKVPSTGKPYSTPDKVVPRFKAGKAFKTAVAAGN